MAGKTNRYAGRLLFLYAIILAVSGVLIARLYELQIVQGEKYRLLADRNRLRVVQVAAPRGVVYAQNGEILARNRPSFSVAVVPADLPKDREGQPDEDQEAIVLNRLMGLLPAPTPSPTPAPASSPTPEGQQAAAKPTVQPTAAVTSTQTGIPERPPLVMTRAEINEAIVKGRIGGAYKPIVVAKYITETTAFKIAEDAVNLPGVQLQLTPIREYTESLLTSHILGYMAPIPEDQLPDYEAKGYGQNDQVGMMGLEYALESELHGKDGQQTIEVDVNGHKVRTIGQPDAPQPGYNLVLTLDLDLQRAATRALQDALKALNKGGFHKVTQGVVVAMDPRTGAVLAMVSLPSYNNNLFAKGITPEAWDTLISDPDVPLINLAVGGRFPPGSVFKMIPAAAGLQTGVINANSRLSDDGGILFLPNKFFPNDASLAQPFVCWSHKYGYGHGAITVREAIAESCDIFFYKLGGGYKEFPGIGVVELGDYAKQFGLGALTGIELPGEVAGLVPDPKWKRLNFKQTWTTGDTYNMSIGQGDVLVTPLQIANMTSAVANRGQLWQPHLVAQLTDSEGKTVTETVPTLIRQVPVDPANLDIVREGMFGTVNWNIGTAPMVKVGGIHVAGKTGSAEFYKDDNKDNIPDKDEKGDMPTHAWFTGFAPYETPEIVITVFISNGGEGSTNAGPVAQKVLEAYFAGKSEG